MKTRIYKSYEDFLKREDKRENGVSKDFADTYPDFEKQNETNEGCWNCHKCIYCYDCNSCDSCDHCKSCESCDFCDFLKDCKGGENL